MEKMIKSIDRSKHRFVVKPEQPEFRKILSEVFDMPDVDTYKTNLTCLLTLHMAQELQKRLLTVSEDIRLSICQYFEREGIDLHKTIVLANNLNNGSFKELDKSVLKSGISYGVLKSLYEHKSNDHKTLRKILHAMPSAAILNLIDDYLHWKVWNAFLLDQKMKCFEALFEYIHETFRDALAEHCSIPSEVIKMFTEYML